MGTYHEGSTAITKFGSFTELSDFVVKRQQEPGSFEHYERELGERMRALECDLKAAQLARYDIDAKVIWVEEKEWTRCLDKEPKTYLSASGPITVERNLFRPKGGGKAVCALDLRAGIVGGVCTPVLARQVSYAMGHMTSAETAALFREFGVEGPSSSTCDRVPKVISEAWEHNREKWEGTLREQETIPAEATILAVSLDGVMVPDKEAQREAKAERKKKQKNLSKPTGGPAGYREVGCGTVTLYAAPENPQRDPEERSPQRLVTVRYGRAPEYKKKTLTEQLDAEVKSIVDARDDLTLVALADGAEENWRYFDGTNWGDAIKIVDIGHACEHLKAGLAAYCGADSVEGRAEYERLKVILRDQHGGVDDVIAELKRPERKLREKNRNKAGKLLRKEREYFQNQRDRMDYANYQELGLPIGSGIVEAACKTLATQRMKRSGMSWGDGKQSVLTIRSLQQSDRWDRGWQLVAEQFRREPLVVERHGQLRSFSQPDYAAAA